MTNLKRKDFHRIEAGYETCDLCQIVGVEPVGDAIWETAEKQEGFGATLFRYPRTVCFCRECFEALAVEVSVRG